MRYQNCIFDLYGTLVDIRTDERSPRLWDPFDGIYLSSDYGCKKPAPRFFRVLLRERGIDPETAVMIGNDGACDVEGAKAVGLSTIYIRSNLSPQEPDPQADFLLHSMNLRRVRNILETGPL